MPPIVRATQFFEFVGGIAQSATDGQTVRLPPALMQPIVSDDVAATLTKIHARYFGIEVNDQSLTPRRSPAPRPDPFRGLAQPLHTSGVSHQAGVNMMITEKNRASGLRLRNRQ